MISCTTAPLAAGGVNYDEDEGSGGEDDFEQFAAAESRLAFERLRFLAQKDAQKRKAANSAERHNEDEHQGAHEEEGDRQGGLEEAPSVEEARRELCEAIDGV